jgi:uncharacterized iron-regulated protein
MASTSSSGAFKRGFYQLFRLSPRAQFGQPVALEDALDEMRAKRLVIHGEIHNNATVAAVQYRMQADAAAALKRNERVDVVLEHFDFEQQALLEWFTNGSITYEECAAAYATGGSFDLAKLRPLLESARADPDRIKLHAGFLPRSSARALMRDPVRGLQEAKERGYIPEHETCEGSEAHYNYFESLLTGRDMHVQGGAKVKDTYRKMFPAQVIKDCSMAMVVNKLVEQGEDTGEQSGGDRIIVLCGAGHMGYNHGLPERVYAEHPQLKSDTCRIITMEANKYETAADVQESLLEVFGQDTDPADFVLVVGSDDADDAEGGGGGGGGGAGGDAGRCAAFGNPPANGGGSSSGCLGPPVGMGVANMGAGLQQQQGLLTACPAPDDTAAGVKAETAHAYDKVGATAHLDGDRVRATAIMRRLGYTAAEIEVAGGDASNYQGVGNPHQHAKVGFTNTPK